MRAPDVLRRHFKPLVIERGARLFEEGAVEEIVGSDDTAKARVLEPDAYDTIIKLHGYRMHVGCNCPFAGVRAEPCAHAWAAVLAADRNGLLANAAWRQPREVAMLGPIAKTTGRAENAPAAPAWERLLDSVRAEGSIVPARDSDMARWPVGREILYVIDSDATRDSHRLALEIVVRDPKKDGSFGQPKRIRIHRRELPLVENPDDRRILAMLEGAPGASEYSYSRYAPVEPMRRVAEPLQEAVVSAIAATGRCRLRRPRDHERNEKLETIEWDDGEPWTFSIEVKRGDGPRLGQYVAAGILRRGETRVAAKEADLLLGGGVVVMNRKAARVAFSASEAWLRFLQHLPAAPIAAADAERFAAEVLATPSAPALELPEELRFAEVRVPPRPCAVIRPPKGDARFRASPKLVVNLSFEYGALRVARIDPRPRIATTKPGRLVVVRDLEAERAAAARIAALGAQTIPVHRRDEHSDLELAQSRLQAAVSALVAEGWRVEADGKLYRPATSVKLRVTSGIDWFELAGAAEFDDAKVSLPELLAALRKRESFVRLGDGTFGVLPEEWLSQLELVTRLGVPKDEALRFAKTQISFLDALLATRPEATWDDAFARARERLREFSGIRPADPTPGFHGALRPYQREGLGWLHFLRDFGFGGCLADDMGLGKTVQVLALLESRRVRKKKRSRPRPRPSLVVVPRSLVFNWKAEAARFAPALSVLDHTGIGRRGDSRHFAEHDVVLTTYGTLRRDVEWLKDVPFDYVILDEAQAIKNRATGAAKSALLLSAEHRLALTGTPVENSLADLWSLFEFLNPGLLGTASAFRDSTANDAEPESRALLARALAPFILRRKKEDVAKDLPEKLEQTLFCELEPAERRLYDELRDHYRKALLERVARDGLEKSKIHVLEALLRLRQAACHPGLVDKTRAEQSSSKLDLLLEQLASVREEGHKAIVFSQFTSLLAIVRGRLDSSGATYEYLDGATKDRKTCVDRFQNDPACPLFLVSLKAGGVGLNLTAAEYVYLLDPWWNPAVESQAIDRAHRIGQTRRVFAYRVIARDTIEERVLDLQAMKRDLADAIIGESAGLLKDLTREDLERLLA